MRSTFKGLFVIHKKRLFSAFLLTSFLIILLFLGAAAADAEDQRGWTLAGTIGVALLSIAAAVGFAVSAALLFRVVGGKEKNSGSGQMVLARRRVACKVLVVGGFMVFSLSGSTLALLWSGLAEDSSQYIMAK